MVEIREIKRSDYDEWYPMWVTHIDLLHKNVSEEVTKEVFKKFFIPEKKLFCRVAVQDDKVIGFVTYAVIEFTQTVEGQLYLNDLFVSPDSRQGGVGRKLVEYVMKAGDDMGIPNLFWFCAYDNAPAHSLYKKLAETHVCVYRRKV